MKRLNELTQKLVDLTNITNVDEKGVIEYELDEGTAFASTLKHNRQVAVVQSFLSEGTIFPYHNHSVSAEVLVVYKGIAVIVSDEGRTELHPGDSINICMGCGHMIHAKTDVKIIAITIPPDTAAMPEKAKKNG